MSNKYIVSDLIKYLNDIGKIDYFNNDEDREKFTAIKDRLIESIRTKGALRDLDWNIEKLINLIANVSVTIADIKTTLNSVENIFKKGV